MKRLLMYLFIICAIITNIYFIFVWEPSGKVAVQQNDFALQKTPTKEVISYSKLVYKFDKEKILERLPSDDRKEFDKIINRLSAFDIGKIKEYYEDYNDEEGAVNICNLLEKRLTIEDYKRIREISSSLLEFDNIEK
jgi:hypothetical protein